MASKRYPSGYRQSDRHKILGEFPVLHTGMEVAESRINFRVIIVPETFGQQFKIVVLCCGLSIVRVIEIKLVWLVFVPRRKRQDGIWLFMLDDDCKGAIQ